MAGKFSKTTTPGRGYTDAVSQSHHPPAGMAAEAPGGSEDAGTESDETPSGRVQGG